MIDLKEKTVIITGADGGIGGGLVEVFANAGARIAAHGIKHSEKLKNLVSSLQARGVAALAVTGDIRSETAMEQMVSEVIAAFGTVDVLINNAGIQPLCAMPEMDYKCWQEVVDVDLNGTFVVTQAVSKQMIAAKTGGSIIHIASIEASLPKKNHSHYDAAKAGVKMYARSCALELGEYGIRVNSVSPGLVDRGGLAQEWPEGYQSWMAAVPVKRTAYPQDIGKACLFLASDLSEFISGHDLVVDGGMSAVASW